MMKSCKSLVAVSTILSTLAAPVAGQSFVTDGDACCTPCEYRLVCQTIVEEQPVTAYRLQTETILEERQVVSYKPVWETEMRERRYTVSKPVAETSSREERYTVLRPVWETQYREETYQRTRMVTETQTREERRIVNRPVVETQMREERRVVHKPVTSTVLQDRVHTTMRPVTVYRQQVVDQGRYVDQWSFTPGTTRNRLRWMPRQTYQNTQTGTVAAQRAGGKVLCARESLFILQP